MTGAEWISLGGLGVTALGGLGWLGSLTWHGGRQAQKLDSAIGDIKDLKDTTAEHAKAISTLDQFVSLLREVRDDVKEMMKSRPSARPRRQGEGD